MRLTSGSMALGLTTFAAAAALAAGSALGATHAARPTITGVFPTSASVGTKVMIAGTNLKNATSVTIAGVKAPFKVFSANAISATVPARAKSGKFTVVTKSGTATSTITLAVIPFRHA